MVTKFVAPEHWLGTIHGALRIGTTGEYWNQEEPVEHRLTDGLEGTKIEKVEEDFIGRSGRIGGITISNVGVVGARDASVEIDTRCNAFVYCVSCGDYDRGLHARIRRRNPSLTCYVVFDCLKLQTALNDSLKACSPAGFSLLHAAPVAYLDNFRTERMSLNALLARYDQASGEPMNGIEAARRAVFTKDESYKHEKEFRFAALPISRQSRPTPLSQLDPAFSKKAANAVVSAGTYKP